MLDMTWWHEVPWLCLISNAQQVWQSESREVSQPAFSRKPAYFWIFPWRSDPTNDILNAYPITEQSWIKHWECSTAVVKGKCNWKLRVLPATSNLAWEVQQWKTSWYAWLFPEPWCSEMEQSPADHSTVSFRIWRMWLGCITKKNSTPCWSCNLQVQACFYKLCCVVWCKLVSGLQHLWRPKWFLSTHNIDDKMWISQSWSLPESTSVLSSMQNWKYNGTLFQLGPIYRTLYETKDSSNTNRTAILNAFGLNYTSPSPLTVIVKMVGFLVNCPVSEGFWSVGQARRRLVSLSKTRVTNVFEKSIIFVASWDKQLPRLAFVVWCDKNASWCTKKRYRRKSNLWPAFRKHGSARTFHPRTF